MMRSNGADPSPRVAVVVPVHNGADALVRLLDALRAQSLPSDAYEVIVVDDASTDGSAEVVRASGLARVVATSRRTGAFGARNVGVAATSAGVLAFTDADCVPDPTWLERGLAALERSEADLVAGDIEIPLAANAPASALVDAARYLNQEQAVRNGFGVTANLFVRRAVFDGIGLFNDKLVSGGDTEFCHRARSAGFALVLEREALVVHPARGTPRELARKAYRVGFGAAQQLRHADGPQRRRNHICKHVGAYTPSWGVPGMERLERRGLRPAMGRRLAMEAVNYFCVQLPIVAGNIHGTLYERRRAART